MTWSTSTGITGTETYKEAADNSKYKSTQGKQLTKAEDILGQQAAEIFYTFLL